MKANPSGQLGSGSDETHSDSKNLLEGCDQFFSPVSPVSLRYKGGRGWRTHTPHVWPSSPRPAAYKQFPPRVTIFQSQAYLRMRKFPNLSTMQKKKRRHIKTLLKKSDFSVHFPIKTREVTPSPRSAPKRDVMRRWIAPNMNCPHPTWQALCWALPRNDRI